MVSKQTIPNYLFIKEKYLPGDRVALITTKGSMELCEAFLIDTLTIHNNWSNLIVDSLKFDKKNDEWNWLLVNKKMQEWFPKQSNTTFIANITGGTKLMSIALFLRMKEIPGSEIYYMPSTDDSYIDCLTNESLSCKINVSVTPEEYMRLYGQSNIQISYPKFGKDVCNTIYNNWDKRNEFIEIKEFIQSKRGKNIFIYPQNQNEKKAFDKYSINAKPIDIETLKNYLKALGFTRKNENMLDKNEVDFLSGGWFEEWTYYSIKENLGLSDCDIVTNVKVKTENNQPTKELDVVFTKNNKLYIVECKSSFDRRIMNMGKLIKEVAGIRDSLGSLNANSIIYILGNGPDEITEKSWQESAKEFKIRLYTADYIRSGNCYSFI